MYIPTSVDAKQVLAELYDGINNLQTAHPNEGFFVFGFFNICWWF